MDIPDQPIPFNGVNINIEDRSLIVLLARDEASIIQNWLTDQPRTLQTVQTEQNTITTQGYPAIDTEEQEESTRRVNTSKQRSREVTLHRTKLSTIIKI